CTCQQGRQPLRHTLRFWCIVSLLRCLGVFFPGGGAGVLVASGGTMSIRVVAQPEKIVLRCRAWQLASYSGLTLITKRQSSGGASRKREAIDLTAFKKGFIISFLC